MTPALQLAPPPKSAKHARVKTVKVADLFCGAGGSSTGARQALAALGLKMELVAVNHWNVAIATHLKNHPDAAHFCQDLATLRPIVAVPGGVLDLLMASPTCTFHSRARGGRPTSDQQRMDPWHVVTWLTELRVKRLLIENVPEFVKWGPIDERTGKPIKSRRGEYFRGWVGAIQALGFKVEWRIAINAADFGDATTRERFFLEARSDGKPIKWPIPTHSRTGGGLPGFGTRKWRAARTIINWDKQGRSIFNRKKPLSKKTLARIYAGAVKFKWPEPFLVILRNHMDAQSVEGPLPTVTAGGTHIGLATPFVQMTRTGSEGRNPEVDPIPSVTASAGGGISLVEPVTDRDVKFRCPDCGFGMWVKHEACPCCLKGKPVPFTISTRQDTGGPAPRSTDEPLVTLVATDSRVGVVEPLILRTDMHQSNAGCVYPAEDPLRTITTTGGHGVLQPIIVSSAHSTTTGRGPNVWTTEEPLRTISTVNDKMVVEPFVLSQASCGAPRSTESPIPTQTTGGNGSSHSLVMPFILSPASGGAPRSAEDPVPAIVAGTGGIAHSLITSYYGSSSSCGSVASPVPTVTTKDRFGLVVPITHTKSSDGGARELEEPLRTIVNAHGSELALVMPVTHHGAGDRSRSVEEPLPTITGAHRGEQAFIVGAFGERIGQAPRVHDLNEPAPTICAQGRIQLVEGVEYDIRFRMLDPDELSAAMGFGDAEQAYEFTGTKTDQIKQIGNAVPVGLARALVAAMFE